MTPSRPEARGGGGRRARRARLGAVLAATALLLPQRGDDSRAVLQERQEAKPSPKQDPKTSAPNESRSGSTRQPQAPPAPRAAGDEAGPLFSSLFYRGWLQELLDRDFQEARQSYEQAAKLQVSDHRVLAMARLWELDCLQADEAGLQEHRLPGAPAGNTNLPEPFARVVRELQAVTRTSVPPQPERLLALRNAMLEVFEQMEDGNRRFPWSLVATITETPENPALQAIAQQRKDAERLGNEALAHELRQQERAMYRSLRRSQPGAQIIRRWTIEILEYRLDGKAEAAARLEKWLRQKLDERRARPAPAAPRDAAELRQRLENRRSFLEHINYLDSRERTIAEGALTRARELATRGSDAEAWELLRPLYHLGF